MTRHSYSLLLLLTLSLPATAQSKPAGPAWPKVTEGQKEQLNIWITRVVRGAAGEAELAEQSVVGFGAGAVPILLARFGDSDKEKAGNSALVRVLDQLLVKEHGPLLVPLMADKRVSARRYGAQKLFQFAHQDLKPAFQKMQGDADAEVALAGSLGLARLGDISCLDALVTPTAKDWKKKGADIREAVKGVKGNPATLKLMEMLAKDDATMKTAALRLLAVAGTKDAVIAIKPYLDKEQGQIKKEAINALRGIVDGDPPLEDLSIFDAIELAKQWKTRT
jgi:hypothetical protein